MIVKVVAFAGAALLRPAWTIPALLALAFAVELGQYWPEVELGAHAASELVRNLAYALVGAVIFQWLLIDRPAKALRLQTYD